MCVHAHLTTCEPCSDASSWRKSSTTALVQHAQGATREARSRSHVCMRTWQRTGRARSMSQTRLHCGGGHPVRPEAACSACVHAHLSKCEPCSPRRRAAAPAHAHMTPWRQYALLACAHAHRATRQLCAAAYHGGGAAHSASGVCTHDATETAHSRSHVCVHAHLTTSSHAPRTHELQLFFLQGESIAICMLITAT